MGTPGQGSKDTNYVQGLGTTVPRPSLARLPGKVEGVAFPLVLPQ